MLPLTDFSETNPETSPDEVLALPVTIVQVDSEQTIVSVNRPESPIFTMIATPGTPLADVLDLDTEARQVIFDLITNAEVTGGALADLRSGSDLYRVSAKPLASAELTLLIFRNTTDLQDGARSIEEHAS